MGPWTAPWSFSLTFSHKRPELPAGSWGLVWSPRSLFLLVKNMGFPNNVVLKSGRDAAGVLMVVGQIWLPVAPPHHD